jgi:hypothetical protein
MHHNPKAFWIVYVQNPNTYYKFVFNGLEGFLMKCAPFKFYTKNFWHLILRLLPLNAHESIVFASLTTWEHMYMQFPMANSKTVNDGARFACWGYWHRLKHP